MKISAVTLCLSVTLGVTWARPQGYGPPPVSGGSGGGGGGGYGGGGGGGGGGSFAPAAYNFQWDINDANSGNFYGHQEQRDGDNTQGSYYVQLPDSRTLKVVYTADQGGYFPVVTYEGEAQFAAGGGGGGGGAGGSYGAPPAPTGSYGAPSGKRK